MAIRIVRLGTPRVPNEGPRLGTVRRPPRGVPKSEFGTRDFYDVWLPELAPTPTLVSWALGSDWTPARWRKFEKRYRAEMSKPPAQHFIATLAALSHTANFSVGCYCEDASRCHRSLLASLLADAGANMKSG